MDHDCASKDIAYAETVCPEVHAGRPAFGEQGREVAGVVRMQVMAKVEMGAGVKKIPSGAVAALVDMECKDIAVVLFCGQSLDVGGYDHAVAHGEKGNGAGYGRVVLSSVDACDGGRAGNSRGLHQINHLTYTLCGTVFACDKTLAKRSGFGYTTCKETLI